MLLKNVCQQFLEYPALIDIFSNIQYHTLYSKAYLIYNRSQIKWSLHHRVFTVF